MYDPLWAYRSHREVLILRVITAGLADLSGVCASFLINSSKALAVIPHSSLNASSFVFPLWLVLIFIVLAAAALIYKFWDAIPSA